MVDVDNPIWDVFNTKVASEPLSDNVCEYCHSTSPPILNDGNIICVDCNSLINRQLDYGAEWRWNTEGNNVIDTTRCCPPLSGSSPFLGSMISGTTRKCHSNWTKLDSSKNNTPHNSHQRFQVWSVISYKSRVLNGIYETLSTCAAQHGLPNCILDDAKLIYKNISDVRITRGENRSAVMAVSMYLACKQNKVPRSIQEIAKMFDMKTSSLTKALHTFDNAKHNESQQSSTPVDFIPRFCSKLGVSDSFVDDVRTVVQNADKLSIICDAMPPSIVGGAIALVNDERKGRLSRKYISEVCIVAPVTITKMVKRLVPYKDILFTIT